MTKIISFSKRRPWLMALLCLLILGIPLAVYAGGISTKNLNENIRETRWCIEEFDWPDTNDTDDGSTPNTTAGSDGTLYGTTINAACESTVCTAIWGDGTDNGLFTPPWVSRLWYDLLDPTANSTLVCTSLIIRGLNQFGDQVSETITSVTETQAKTTHVYSLVERIDLTGCSGGTAAEDAFILYTSAEIGLKTDVRNWRDVEQLCLLDGGATWVCAEGSNGTTGDIESAVNLTIDTIELSTANLFGNTIEAAPGMVDGFCITTRSSLR